MNEPAPNNLNPLKIFLIGLAALICLGAIAIFIDQSSISKKDRAEAPKKLADRSMINLQVENVLFDIHRRIWGKYLAMKAEEDLEKQTLPGKVALAVIELNEAKASLAKNDNSLEKSFKKLRDLEEKFSNENTVSSRKPREMEGKLKRFADYTDRVLFEHQSAQRFKGILSPDTKALFAESLRIHEIKLGDVLRGGYEAEIVLRMETERRDLVESRMKEIRESQSEK